MGVRHCCNSSISKRSLTFACHGAGIANVPPRGLEAEMQHLRRSLLGVAAGLFTVTVARAADMPVKANPVQYVKICSGYGDGFYYIPGTDTCIKMGGYLRIQGEYNAGAGG